jgi:LPS-assembly lipoprotein
MWSSEAGARRALLAAAGGLLLAGCGFELRRPPQMPFQRLALAGFAPRSPLAEALRRALAPGVDVKERAADAQVVLHALADERGNSVVAQTSAAQVRELRLRLRFAFRAETPAGRELIAPGELLLTRDMSYSETAALAKEQEEQELFRAMQADVVQQVLRRLAAIRL